MSRRGSEYSLTYCDTDLPDHYGWKTEFRLGRLQARLADVSGREARRILSALDDQGRWMSRYGGEKLVGQPQMREGETYLSSERFSSHLTRLSECLLGIDR